MIQGSDEGDRRGFAGGVNTAPHSFADALVAAGLLVPRYDKQGVGASLRDDDTLGRGYSNAVEAAARPAREAGGDGPLIRN